jgi:outer membrane lipoprotein-sorting protein
MRIFSSRPTLRWLVPAAAVGVIGGTTLLAASATAEPALPKITAAKLLVDLQSAQVDNLSGTVVQKSDLGLPDLPNVGGGSSSNPSLTSMITGSHTLNVWLSGPDKQRVRVIGTLGETDLIRSGSDVWNWSSDTNTATHRKLTADQSPTQARKSPGNAPNTPQEAANTLLKNLDPTTSVTIKRTEMVAGRAAYDLVLTPKNTSGQPASLIRQVRIAVDGQTHIPLGVDVYPVRSANPVFRVAFTQVDFSRPDDGRFVFNPRPGVKVTEEPSAKPSAPAATQAHKKASQQAKAAQPKIVGTGWSTVVVSKMDPAALTSPAPAQGKSGASDQQIQRVLNSLPRVSGAWGSGRLLSGKAFSVLITDDGRIAAGAVAPSALYAALR